MASGSKGSPGSTWGLEPAAVVWRRAVRSSMLHLCPMSHLWRCNRVDINIIMSCTGPHTSLNYILQNFALQPSLEIMKMLCSPLNPVWYDPSVMNIRYGGGQKHLRYIIQIYISQFKSDYSGVKSKSEVHIIRSHLEKKNCKNFQKWMSYRCFCLSFENSKKI